MSPSLYSKCGPSPPSSLTGGLKSSFFNFHQNVLGSLKGQREVERLLSSHILLWEWVPPTCTASP